ncbi:MAG: oligopeptide transporter, OPT family [Planctomycetota bacterium]
MPEESRRESGGVFDHSVSGEEYKPYVPATKTIAEFSLKAVVTGVILGILFGMANAYLGLAAGVTVSASIPVAVMSVGVFSALHKFGLGRRATVLESNMSQTIGSAGESLAAGVIFTIPALILWGESPDEMTIFIFAALGGILGVLCMIPLRRYLVKEEHRNLPFPEGTACAEVLVGSDVGGVKAKRVFVGLGIGAAYTFLMNVVGLWKGGVSLTIGALRNAKLSLGLNPAYLGVGYILGRRIATMMVAGSVLAAVVFFPLVAQYVDMDWQKVAPPQLADTLAKLETVEAKKAAIISFYIRHIGVGAVAFAGIITLIRTFPTIIGTLRLTAARAIAGRRGDAPVDARTDRDIGFRIVLGGVIVLAIIIAFVPIIPVRIIGAALIVVFGFIFVTVSSRICGIVGSSSNPVSGMTIATLIGATLLITAMGITGMEAKVAAISVGAAVCIAAAVAGDTAQDLKTGFLVGATPWKQQIGEGIGVLTSAAFIGVTLLILHSTYTIGSEKISAPQAMTMKAIVDGLVGGNLPWLFLLTGAAIAAVFELLGMRSLPLAVGLYIPLGTTAPIFIGGLLREGVDRKLKKSGVRGEREGGVLFGSGMIGGEGLVMVVAALIITWVLGPGAGGFKLLPGFVGGIAGFFGWQYAPDIISLLPFLLLCWLLYKACGIRKKPTGAGQVE